MGLKRWSSDTIGRWFAVNIVAAVMIAACMNLAFVQFAGVWAKPSIFEVGLVDQACAVVRVMEGAPRSLRPALAKAADNDLYVAHWFSDDAALPMPIEESTFDAGREKIQRLLGRPSARALAYQPGDPGMHGKRASEYAIAISMSDGSWVQFVATQRSWGLTPGMRNLLTGSFLLICSLSVAAIASRRLARPMERFASQAQRFGTDVNAAPMAFSGPVEFRVAAQAFNEMQSRIQRHVSGRTELLAAISHDLRAPLTRMRLRGEFIDDDEQQRKLFRDVDEMQAMVDSSLTFFREESRREETTRFRLTELVNTVVDDFRDQGHEVRFEQPAGITYVGRPLALRRSLSNVIDNAIKYGAYAAVTIRTRPGWIDVVIEDGGPGIPDDLREAVFRPFFRIESSRNRLTGGVGLGLASARSAAREHGGDILLAKGNPGLVVTLTLPVVSA